MGLLNFVKSKSAEAKAAGRPDGDGDDGDRGRVVKLVDHFLHEGPHGSHACLIFELAGPNLLSLIRRHGRLPLSAVRRLTRQTCEALEFLHDTCGIIHVRDEGWLLLLD